MNRFHSQKLVESFEALNKGRLRKIRRKTLARESDLNEILSKFEGLPEAKKIDTLKYHILSCGTVCSDKLDPSFFDLLPPLEEISDIEFRIEPIIAEKSFLDDTDSIPDLEQVPEMSEIPSFLGTEYQARQCGRVLRSGNVRYHPFI